MSLMPISFICFSHFSWSAFVFSSKVSFDTSPREPHLLLFLKKSSSSFSSLFDALVKLTNLIEFLYRFHFEFLDGLLSSLQSSRGLSCSPQFGIVSSLIFDLKRNLVCHIIGGGLTTNLNLRLKLGRERTEFEKREGGERGMVRGELMRFSIGSDIKFKVPNLTNYVTKNKSK